MARTVIEIPDEMHDRLRLISVTEKMDLKDIYSMVVLPALEKYLEELQERADTDNDE